jgi:hypothetical protein
LKYHPGVGEGYGFQTEYRSLQVPSNNLSPKLDPDQDLLVKISDPDPAKTSVYDWMRSQMSTTAFTFSYFSLSLFNFYPLIEGLYFVPKTISPTPDAFLAKFSKLCVNFTVCLSIFIIYFLFVAFLSHLTPFYLRFFIPPPPIFQKLTPAQNACGLYFFTTGPRGVRHSAILEAAGEGVGDPSHPKAKRHAVHPEAREEQGRVLSQQQSGSA